MIAPHINSKGASGLSSLIPKNEETLTARYASRAALMLPSEIRSLFAVASRPEIVSLAGGMPNLSALPMDVMASVVQKLVLENGTEALQYGSGQGHPKFMIVMPLAEAFIILPSLPSTGTLFHSANSST